MDDTQFSKTVCKAKEEWIRRMTDKLKAEIGNRPIQLIDAYVWSPELAPKGWMRQLANHYNKEHTSNIQTYIGLYPRDKPLPAPSRQSFFRFRFTPPPAPNLMRVWALFPLILPRSTRRELWEPTIEEMKEDYLIAKKSYRTEWAKRWISFAFTVRTTSLVAQCLWVAAGAKGRTAAGAALTWLFGPQAAEWFRQLFVTLFGRLP